MGIFSIFKEKRIEGALLKQRFKIEEDCRKSYEKERILRDNAHESELSRKLREQSDDFNRQISEINDKHDKVCKRMSFELEYFKGQNSRMRQEYKDFAVLNDSLSMLLRRVNGMMSGIRNEFNIQLAQFSQKYLYVEDEIEKFRDSLGSKKFKLLSKDNTEDV